MNRLPTSLPKPPEPRITRFISRNAFLPVLICLVLAGCGGPDIARPDQTVAPPTETATVAAPTAALGATTGAPCESGTLKLLDLAEIEKRWRGGLAATTGRALGWQDDAVLIELGVSCELFESGFRWQTTYFSRTAQAYYRADTTEVIPVNTDPDTIIPLPESEIDFDALLTVLMSSTEISLDVNVVITEIDVRVSTPETPIGPPGVPTGTAIYHVALRHQGQVLELYIDGVRGDIYQFE